MAIYWNIGYQVIQTCVFEPRDRHAGELMSPETPSFGCRLLKYAATQWLKYHIRNLALPADSLCFSLGVYPWKPQYLCRFCKKYKLHICLQHLTHKCIIFVWILADLWCNETYQSPECWHWTNYPTCLCCHDDVTSFRDSYSSHHGAQW